MKVAILTPRFPPNGGEGYSYHMAMALKENGHEPVVHVPGKRDKAYKYDGIDVFSWRQKASFGEFAKLWFPDLKGYDVIHLCGGYRHPHMYHALTRKGRAKIVMSPFYPVKPRDKFVHKVLQGVIDATIGRLALRSMDMVFAETYIEKAWLQSWGVFKTQLVPNPIEDKYLDQRTGKRFREKYGVEGRMIFFLGGHSYIKNVWDLIEITPNMDATFVIGGEGLLTEKYKDRLRELGTLDKVIFPGTFFDDVEMKFEAFAAADVFVLPSLKEGLGGVLIEAMAQGTPVIAANRGGLPAVVPDEWCLYEPGDTKHLARGINQLFKMGGLRKKIIRKGKTKAQNYAFSKISKRYVRTLERMVKNGRTEISDGDGNDEEAKAKRVY